jgi:hypothetical protein
VPSYTNCTTLIPKPPSKCYFEYDDLMDWRGRSVATLARERFPDVTVPACEDLAMLTDSDHRIG